MAHDAFRWIAFGCGAIGTLAALTVRAQAPHGHNGGVQNGPQQTYQRQGFEWSRRGRDRGRNDFRQSFPFTSPQVNSGWYQRPYPTHLDYFRLRSNEAPPPYYGNSYGSYGGWAGPVGVWDNEGGGYETQSDDAGVNSGQGVSPRALLTHPPSEQSKGGDATGKVMAPEGGSSESLPAPSK